MDTILKFILSHCSFLYKKFGFKFIDSLVSESFGGDALLVLENDVFQIQFVYDRAQLLLRFKPKTTKTWYSIDLARMLICGEENHYSSIMDANHAKFMEENFEEILSLFSPEKVENTLKECERLAQIRSDRMFPKKKRNRKEK